MAQIKYLDSRRIMGASTDTVQDNYFEDSYTSNSGWTQSGSTITVNSGVSGKVHWNSTNSTGTDYVWKSLGMTLSDTEWVARFEYKRTAGTSCCERFHVFALSSASTHIGSNSQDMLGFGVNNTDVSADFYCIYKDGSTYGESVSTVDVSTGTQYYIELARTSSTNLRLKVFSDSAYTTQVGSTVNYTVPATVTSLSYLHHSSANNAYSVVISGELDNTKIWNETTTPFTVTYKPAPVLSLSGCKAYYNFEQTSGGGSVYNTQFNDSSGWTSSGSDVTISGGLAQYVISSGTSTSRIYRSQSITATFEANFDFIINSESRSDSSSQLLFTLSDSIYVGSGLGDTTGSYIGFGVLYEASPARSTWIKSRYNNTDDASDSGTYNFSTSTQYFAKVKRTSPTSVNYSVYGSDSDRTSETNSLTSRTMTISSNIPDLDYIIIGGRATGSGASDIDIDNISNAVVDETPL